jgi:hypothetical protein
MKESKIIKKDSDPKGREVFLIQYGQKYRVEKPANGYLSAFVGLQKAELIFNEQIQNSN